jgi:hypothetical protein
MASQRLPASRGRTREREVLDRPLDVVRAGQGAALVIPGEEGVGTTAPLRYDEVSSRDRDAALA